MNYFYLTEAAKKQGIPDPPTHFGGIAIYVEDNTLDYQNMVSLSADGEIYVNGEFYVSAKMGVLTPIVLKNLKRGWNTITHDANSLFQQYIYGNDIIGGFYSYYIDGGFLPMLQFALSPYSIWLNPDMVYSGLYIIVTGSVFANNYAALVKLLNSLQISFGQINLSRSNYTEELAPQFRAKGYSVILEN